MAEIHRKRKHRFRINLTESEAKIAIEKAEKVGLKMGDFIRQIIVSGPVVSFMDSDMIHSLLNDFQEIKSVMDQIVSECKNQEAVSEEDYERLELQIVDLEAAVYKYFYSEGAKEKVVLKINGKLIEENLAKVLAPLFKEAYDKSSRRRKKVKIKDDSDYNVFQKENEMGWRSFQLSLNDEELNAGKELSRMTNLNMSNLIRFVIMRGSAHSSEAMDLLREVSPVIEGMKSNVLSLLIIANKDHHRNSDMMDRLFASKSEIEYIQGVVYHYLYTAEK